MTSRPVVAGLVAVLLSTLAPVLTTGDGSALVALAVAVALVALLAVAPVGASYAGAVPSLARPAHGVAPRPTGRVGDPTHHPLRPRAPGRG